MPNISVIIPIYNSEPYIERCAFSLLSQSLDDIEYIFIDDGSTDKSIAILESVVMQFQERLPQVLILRNGKNKGLAYTRAKGLKLVTGDYLISCDSDDWVEPDMYEKLYKKAISSGADVTICDFSFEGKYNGCFENVPRIEDPQVLINSLSKHYITWSLWNKLIKSSIIKDNQIYSFEGIEFGEDLGLIIRVLYHSKRVSFVDGVYYHYNVSNPNSICSSLDFDNRKLQQVACVNRLKSFMGNKKDNFNRFFASYELMIKNGYLLRNYLDYEKWRGVCPDLRWDILLVEKVNIVLRFCYILLSFGFTWPYRLYMKLATIK